MKHYVLLSIIATAKEITMLPGDSVDFPEPDSGGTPLRQQQKD